MKKNLLIITNLYPYKENKHSSTFNEQQIAYLSEYYEKVFIICPIPWTGVVRGQYKPYTKIFTKNEKITVYYPVYFYTPGILRSFYWIFYFLSILPVVLHIKKNYHIDRLFATWLYPDGFSAYWISRLLHIPLTVKAHGTDVNIYGTKKIIRLFYRFYLNHCHKVITVSEDLKNKLISMKINPSKIKTIYNGIDLSKFDISEKVDSSILEIIDPSFKNILYIGNLKKSKGILDVLNFYKENELNRKNVRLYYIGDGPDRNELIRQIKRNNLDPFVILLGKISHADIPKYLNIVDYLILLSPNEGIPNVMLEAFACGTPVIINDTGGIKEIFQESTCGVWADKINKSNIDSILMKKYDRQYIRNTIKHFTWENNSKVLFRFLR